MCAQDGEGVVYSETICQLIKVILSFLARGSGCHHVASRISTLDYFPKLVQRQFFCVHVISRRCTVEGLQCHSRIATVGVRVVAMVLGKSLLKNSTPKGAIDARTSYSSGVLCTFFSEGKVIVYNDRVRDTEGVHIYTVDAVCVQFIVQEY